MASHQSYASVATNQDKQGKQEDHKDTGKSKNSHSPSSKQDTASANGQSHGGNPQDSGSNSNSKDSSSRGRNKSPQSKSSGQYTAEEYIRRPEHIPNTRGNRKSPSPNGDTEQHYILTLLTDQSLHDYMTSLRRKYFPPHINRIDAHISLFHALPGSKLDMVKQDIKDVCERQRPFPIVAEEATSPKLVNVLIQASSPHFAIEGIQKQLRLKWDEFLSDQDKGGMRPHWTVLNKVSDKGEVKKALGKIQDDFKRTEGEVRGFELWRYERGYWKDKEVFEFGRKS